MIACDATSTTQWVLLAHLLELLVTLAQQIIPQKNQLFFLRRKMLCFDDAKVLAFNVLFIHLIHELLEQALIIEEEVECLR